MPLVRKTNSCQRLVFNQPPKGKLQPKKATLYETIQCSTTLCTPVFWHHQRTVILFQKVACQSSQTDVHKIPHPGSEIVCTTVRHKVTQANPDNPGKGSISRVMQVARFLLSCLKTPFFQASQPDSYQAPCLDTPIPAQPGASSLASSTSKAGWVPRSPNNHVEKTDVLNICFQFPPWVTLC